jgi:hypothetical protein
MPASLSNYVMVSPSTMLSMIVEECACFAVVDLIVAIQRICRSRELAIETSCTKVQMSVF